MLGIKEAEYLAEGYVSLPPINFPVGKRRQIDCDFRAVIRRRPRPLDRFDLHQPDLGFVVLSHSPSLLLFKDKFPSSPLCALIRAIHQKPFTMRRSNGRGNRMILTPTIKRLQTRD